MLKTCGECMFFNSGQPLNDGQHMALCGQPKPGCRPWRRDDQEPCPESRKSTLDRIQWGLLGRPSVCLPFCGVCGRTGRLEQHHVVRRGDGNVYGWDGRPARKPTLTLCGFGNTGGCHGDAHGHMLHFRYTDRWEYLRTWEPTEYAEALRMDGWRPYGRRPLGGMEW